MKEVAIPCEEDSPLADGPWLVQPMLDSVHVVFERESGRHEMDRGCWCRPDVEVRDPSTKRLYPKLLVIHRRIEPGAT